MRLTTKDLREKVPEIGNNAIRRPLPKGLVKGYLSSIKLAYNSTGLDPNAHPQVPLRPGFEDEHGSFQVGLSTVPKTGLHEGFFIIGSTEGLVAVEGLIKCERDEQTALDAAGLAVRGWNKFPLTRGNGGSIALVTRFILDSYKDHRFQPVPAVATQLL